MTILYTFEIICDLISAILIVYFFNKIIPAKNKKYSKVSSIIMIIFYTSISKININNTFIIMNGSKIVNFMLFQYTLSLIYPLLFRKGRISEKFFCHHYILLLC